jgi:hypothetical protein
MMSFLWPNATGFYANFFGDAGGGAAKWIAGYIISRPQEKVTLSELRRASDEKLSDREILEAMATLYMVHWVGSPLFRRTSIDFVEYKPGCASDLCRAWQG